jgi:hypothetical protein
MSIKGIRSLEAEATYLIFIKRRFCYLKNRLKIKTTKIDFSEGNYIQQVISVTIRYFLILFGTVVSQDKFFKRQLTFVVSLGNAEYYLVG